jgi:UDP-N-acetyl-D-mannosaminuronic acid dehydrogenase
MVMAVPENALPAFSNAISPPQLPPETMKYDICVVGLGYIGLPTASIFAARGKKVYGLEINPKVVATINRGEIHIVEPDLDVLVRAAVQSGNLVAGTEPVEADTYILAVPTPFEHRGQIPLPDLKYVESAARAVAAEATANSLIILESTSPVGTTSKVKGWVDDERAKRGLPAIPTAGYAHCPERILPGQMLKELVSNDRLCGGLTPEASNRACELYSIFCSGEIHVTDADTAEMVKLTENASRDVQIAFANELSLVCDRLELDVWEVIRLANRHPRVKILQPGPGVGGHCIAVDPWFIVAAAPDISPLMATARRVNDSKPQWVLDKVRALADRFVAPTIACLGLAFKADVDDLRESPSLHIVEALAGDTNFTLLVDEPYVQELPASLIRPNVRKVGTIEAVRAADIVVLLVNHRAYASIDRDLLQTKAVVDTRGIWS